MPSLAVYERKADIIIYYNSNFLQIVLIVELALICLAREYHF